MHIKDGGDLIQAHGYHKLRWDGRNALFVRYKLATDRLAHLPNAKPDFYGKSYYSELKYLFELPLPPQSVVNPEAEPRSLILALILEAETTVDDDYSYKVAWYDGSLGSGEVVDAQTIQCAIGQIKDGNHWWIIDRSLDLAHLEFV
ncbi:hypothetical protein BN14_12301 [Rhizoctonia solani AG-1 IB]|uniref:Uncharacterized protein n=1 Tax=Thanatephorus cucumeris (strain AG1-IB / isolate 7/3/14) TaxID=1108050 RepID=M5CFA6_THACB|nr:hypothetical protein BN14_12301 [Rhizoctonia solani AG-1 IB]